VEEFSAHLFRKSGAVDRAGTALAAGDENKGEDERQGSEPGTESGAKMVCGFHNQPP
jgi:hypothetical protein